MLIKYDNGFMSQALLTWQECIGHEAVLMHTGLHHLVNHGRILHVAAIARSGRLECLERPEFLQRLHNLQICSRGRKKVGERNRV